MASGRNLERTGKHEEARQIYERLVAGCPRRYEAYHRLAVVADRQRRHREAQALYSQAIRLHAATHEDKLPKSLGDVTEVPVPVNPFTGGPFVYRLEGDTAILEAAGPEDSYARHYRVKLAE